MSNKDFPWELWWSFNGRTVDPPPPKKKKGQRKAPSIPADQKSDFLVEVKKALKRWNEKPQFNGIEPTKIAIHGDHAGSFKNGRLPVNASGIKSLEIVLDNALGIKIFAIRGRFVDT